MDQLEFNITENALNDTENEMLLDYLNPPATPIGIAVETIKFSMCVVGTVVDLLIIYIIFNYKIMHKPVNIYIMNWLICGASLILFDPSEYRLYRILVNNNVDPKILCLILSCLVIFATAKILFTLLLMLHWFCVNRKSVVLDRHSCKIIAAVWIFVFIEFLVTSSQCVSKNMFHNLGEIFLGVVTAVSIICFIVILCMRRCANPFAATGSLPVALITSFMICWITLFSNAILFELEFGNIFLTFVHLGKIIVYLYPLLVFYLFLKMDQNFAKCTRILFRKQIPEDTENCREEIDQRHDNNATIDIQSV